MADRWTNSKLDSRIRRLDTVSDDIRDLEAYLARCGVLGRTAPVELPGRIGDAVYWGEHDKEDGRMRLMHLSGAGLVRPLIEAPGSARLAAAEALPEVLRRVAAMVEEA